MVSGSRIEGGPQILSAGVRKTIQSIKEIVGNHSDADIYVTLKETNMDPNETTQKLLNQDHFHEVKRKKDKRKEVTVNKGSIASQPRKHTEHVNQGMRFNTYSDHNIRRGGYSRNALPDARVSREFRVVRDNRTNQNTNSEIKAPSARSPISTNELEIPKISEKSSPTGASNNQKPPVGRHSSQSSNGFTDLHPRQARDAHLSDKKDSLEDMRLSIPNTGSQMQSMKPSDFQSNSTTSSNYSVAGVYSSSLDPVHVPSPDSRPATNIGAIKREVGAVGVRRQSIENSFNLSSAQSNSISKSHLRHDCPSRESFRSSTDMSKSDQPNQTPVSEPAMPSISVSKPFMNNQFSSRQHQPVGHQKASQTNKEWKPKSTQKQSSIGPGVIGTPAKLTSPPADVPKNLETDAILLQDKFSRVNISENQNVIIAAHIRVSETDRSRMIFGSLGTEFESSRNPSFQAIEGAVVSHMEPSASLSFSAPESSSDESSGKKQVDLLDECVRNSGTNSPAASMTVSELQLTDTNESSSPQDFDNYADIALVHDKSPSYTPSQSQQQQDHPQLPSFSAYDPQTMYDIPYFRSAVHETVRGHGLQFPQEALSSHTTNSIPASTVAMVQQPPPMTQMYPQVHVSHYANLMPYRQFLSPVYVPPMAVPSYSNNPAYPHPSNGNGYLVMPGGSSHLTASGLKYGIQQYKPVPTGSPTGFGNFTSPTGYTINAPGVGSATGLEDSSRLKYKDGNLYVPNPQAETSEVWMNPRDVPSLQSASYYMTGQTPHAAAYLPSHTGHASFNSVSQSSHMQFPGMYHHPTQASGIPSPHHLSPAMGGNVGVGVAAGGPGAQVGAYQQPQLGHMNWTGNF